ncbi:MAG: PSD1 and planctomycete cytochrome C domain-containing protein [Planctomycetota bacterium]
MKATQIAGLLLALAVTHGAAEGREISFNRDIRPILSDRCYYCHGFDENHREADLRLDIREEAEYVWDSDYPDDSELIYRITTDDPDLVMPPPYAHKQAITEAEVDLIRRWIAQGAKYEPHWAFVNPSRPETSAKTVSDAIDDFVSRRHAERGLEFAPPALPTKWLRRASLDLTGVPPTVAELKSFENAVRRQGEQAYVAAVDRLLSSPRYGERMALEWLDVARYADTNGFQADAYRMNWPWRDWVVHAFSENMPYDRFTLEQLAGDLLTGPDGKGPTRDQLIATAFNRNHMIQSEGGSIPAENRAKNNFDRVETTGTAWMGLTVGCSQCHDHKFDPIKQTDYYSFLSFFNQISETGLTSKKFELKREGDRFARKYWVDKPFIAVSDEASRARLDRAEADVASARAVLESRRDEYLAAARDWILKMRRDARAAEAEGRDPKYTTYAARFLFDADIENPRDRKFKLLINDFIKTVEPWRTLQGRVDDAIAAASRIREDIPLVMVMRDDNPRDTFVMLRGSYETLGEKVFQGTPEFLPPLKVERQDSRPTRLDLARWLVSPEHPLTARVTVNRYWQLMFGRGLVSTPDDFGLQGALPTHPDLLDWLAVEFRDGGWDLKAFLKGVALSRTYRQTAAADDADYLDDPYNEWLARGPRARLDSRLLRDQALALSGLLVERIGGPPVFPYQPGGIWEAMSLNKNHYMRGDGEDLYRRSLYTTWRRVVAPANFFDVPSRQSCSVTVTRTSTPLHALTTLNDITYAEAARVWAEEAATAGDDEAGLSDLFYAATARRPGAAESASLLSSLERARRHFKSRPAEAGDFVGVGETSASADIPAAEHAAWTTVCLLVLNLDETLCK